MFRRRTPLTRINQIRSFIWPERGFRRLFAYFFQRVVRMPGTSASIAAGMASGGGSVLYTVCRVTFADRSIAGDSISGKCSGIGDWHVFWQSLDIFIHLGV